MVRLSHRDRIRSAWKILRDGTLILEIFWFEKDTEDGGKWFEDISVSIAGEYLEELDLGARVEIDPESTTINIDTEGNNS